MSCDICSYYNRLEWEIYLLVVVFIHRRDITFNRYVLTLVMLILNPVYIWIDIHYLTASPYTREFSFPSNVKGALHNSRPALVSRAYYKILSISASIMHRLHFTHRLMPFHVLHMTSCPLLCIQCILYLSRFLVMVRSFLIYQIQRMCTLFHTRPEVLYLFTYIPHISWCLWILTKSSNVSLFKA